MSRKLRRVLLGAINIIIAVYLIMAVTSFNKPEETHPACTKVIINIEDETTNGFLSAAEIKNILEKAHIYPFNKKMKEVNPRDIEDKLKDTPFVNTAQCYKTTDGCVCVSITQRLPIVRIKSVSGEDYYLDDKGGIMPNSKYTSDLIIATGRISKWYAKNYLANLAGEIMKNDLWKNQIVQINIRGDLGVELVPRVGDHIVYLGVLPQAKNKSRRAALIADFMTKKLDRLGKFYKYGLSQAGWNKYSYIDVEFGNQIICKKRNMTGV